MTGDKRDICILPSRRRLESLGRDRIRVAAPAKLNLSLLVGPVRADGFHPIDSIVAKVTRDRLMVELDCQYPEYGFASHKGYCCKAHLDALDRLGPSPCHRRSFAPVYERSCQCRLNVEEPVEAPR